MGIERWVGINDDGMTDQAEASAGLSVTLPPVLQVVLHPIPHRVKIGYRSGAWDLNLPLLRRRMPHILLIASLCNLGVVAFLQPPEPENATLERGLFNE